MSLGEIWWKISVKNQIWWKISVKNISWLSKNQDKIFCGYVWTKIGSVNCCWRVCSIQCGRIRWIFQKRKEREKDKSCVWNLWFESPKIRIKMISSAHNSKFQSEFTALEYIEKPPVSIGLINLIILAAQCVFVLILTCFCISF